MTTATQNPAYGFYGTIGYTDGIDTEHAWKYAMSAIALATACNQHEVRAFLDSSFGRHFADQVRDNLLTAAGDPQMTTPAYVEAAIRAATTRWMDWRISKKITRQFEIPHSLPYLTGFVIHAAIEADQI